METNSGTLDTFEVWIRANKQRFEGWSIGVEYFGFEQDKFVVTKQSVRVRFETEDFISDIGVWDNGECDVEVLDCKTAEHVLFDTHEFGTIEEMDSVLDDVSEYLINLYETRL